MHYTRPKLIQLIHIAKQKFGMDEYSYRVMLERITGKKSCKEMNVTDLTKVMHELEQKGFKKTVRKNRSPSTKSAVGKSRIITKIRAIWITMTKAGIVRDGSEKALNRFAVGIINTMLAKQGNNLRMLNLQSLNDYQAGIVLERLKQWAKRGGLDV